MRTWILSATVVAGLLHLPLTAAVARARTDGAKAAGLAHGARALTDKGIQALNANDLSAAARLLTDAYRQSQSPEILYQLGRLAQAEGRSVDAYDLMRRYLADPAREADEPAVRAAEELVNRPPPASGSLTVVSDPGALLFVDSRAVATLPLLAPLLVPPGAHTVVLELPSKKMEAPVQIETGRLTEVRMSRASGAVLVSVLPAILLCKTELGVPPEASRPLAEAIEQVARDENHTLLRTDTLLAKGEQSQRCLASEACQRDLATKHKAELVLQQAVTVGVGNKSAAWSFKLRLLRAGITEPAAAQDKTCDGCSVAQAVAALQEATAKVLAAGLSRQHGSLRLTAAPAAATVYLGDRRFEVGPRGEALWAGSYEVRASHPGYAPQLRTLEVQAGQPALLHIELARPAESARQGSVVEGRAQRPRWRLVVGGTMLGLGLVLGATGAVGIGIYRQCGSPSNPPDPCPLLYDTLAPGIFAAVSGGLLMGSGGLLLGLPESHR